MKPTIEGQLQEQNVCVFASLYLFGYWLHFCHHLLPITTNASIALIARKKKFLLAVTFKFSSWKRKREDV